MLRCAALTKSRLLFRILLIDADSRKTSILWVFVPFLNLCVYNSPAIARSG